MRQIRKMLEYLQIFASLLELELCYKYVNTARVRALNVENNTLYGKKSFLIFFNFLSFRIYVNNILKNEREESDVIDKELSVTPIATYYSMNYPSGFDFIKE